MQNIVKVIFVMIGTIIGAGFASGREIYIFFNAYNEKGLYGLILSTVLTGMTIYKVLSLIKENDIKDYNNLLLTINKSKKINKIIKIIINIFLVLSYYIMVAGFSGLLEQEYGIPTIISSIIFTLICYFTLKGNIQRIINANFFLIPILIIIIVIIFFINVNLTEINLFNQNIIQDVKYNWVISSILYSSYNSILLIPILIGLSKNVKDKKSNMIISTICSIITLLLGVFIYLMLLQSNNNLAIIELPLVYVIKNFGNIYAIIYTYVMIVAIYTSAISAAYGVLENYNNNIKKYNSMLLIMSILAIPIANIGFANLVNILYPIFGFLGFIQIINILIKHRKSKEAKMLNLKK